MPDTKDAPNSRVHLTDHMNPTEIITRIYGPYAFGIVSMLILWAVIVKPELQAQRINFEAQTEVLMQMREIQRSQAEMANSLDTTSKVFVDTAKSLERTSQTLKEVSTMIQESSVR